MGAALAALLRPLPGSSAFPAGPHSPHGPLQPAHLPCSSTTQEDSAIRFGGPELSLSGHSRQEGTTEVQRRGLPERLEI